MADLIHQMTAQDWGKVGLIGQGFGLLNSTMGSYFSAASQKSNLKFQAQMAELNAKQAEKTAQSALNQGNQQAVAITLQAGHLKSRQIVG
ncbi:MAG: hypothetical protein LBV49_12255 [Azonexus sp.]|nr:hypothetical protein [Azonexus sp.]